MIKRLPCLLLMVLLCAFSVVKGQKLLVLQQGRASSLRGLCVVNDHVAWVSGNKGTVALTTDGGKTWNWQQVKGYEASDFRDIEAFSAKEAFIMSSGTPALILYTRDAGHTWLTKYRNRDTSVFLDAIDFKGKYGVAMADPEYNHFVLLETHDKGNTWKQKDILRSPPARPGEAGFAASGSCLRIVDNGMMKEDGLLLISGGTSANIMYGLLSGRKWSKQPLPIAQGSTSAGAFSIVMNGSHWVVAGGDYQHDHRTDSTMCYSNNSGKTWAVSKAAPGYQSCVEYLGSSKYISTGTSGTWLSIDGAKTWHLIDAGSYNVVYKTRHGNLTLLAGSNGSIAMYVPGKK